MGQPFSGFYAVFLPLGSSEAVPERVRDSVSVVGLYQSSPMEGPGEARGNDSLVPPAEACLGLMTSSSCLMSWPEQPAAARRVVWLRLALKQTEAHRD